MRFRFFYKEWAHSSKLTNSNLNTDFKTLLDLISIKVAMEDSK